MKIVTFNIRCPWKDRDGINDFIHRAGLIYDKVEAEKPEVIAFQEIRKPTLELLQKMFPDYSFFGTLREKDYTGEGVYTAIRKDASGAGACIGCGKCEHHCPQNIAIRTELKNAQKNPDEYRDLMVRITGYSAIFVDMSKGAQDEFIRREELE